MYHFSARFPSERPTDKNKKKKKNKKSKENKTDEVNDSLA